MVSNLSIENLSGVGLGAAQNRWLSDRGMLRPDSRAEAGRTGRPALRSVFLNGEGGRGLAQRSPTAAP